MLASILLSSILALPALAASPDDWRTKSIYQLVTDRFATPDGSSPQCNTEDRKYCGGTYKGIMNKLDYIQNMGFDAIWISPIVKNVEGATAYGEAFHGYWTEDINSLNSHFGSADDLKSLASELHKRNMYLMVDVVVNHMAATSNPPNFGSFAPFNQQSDFHNFCFIQASDYDNNQTAVEQCWLGDEKLPLADINTEDPNIVSTWNTWIGDLVKNYSIDGVRIDTVKHVRKDFWSDFAKSAGVYTVGEVLHNDTNYVAPYTQALSAALDYPAYFALTTGFQSTSGNLSALAAVVQSGQSVYNNGEHYMGSFLENHDNPRFQSLTQDEALVKNAMTWPFIQDGIPILYYGQEQSYAGGADPANREALWLSGYGEDKPLVQHVKTLNAARKAAATANKDFYTSSLKFLVASTNNLAISKPPMLTLLTNEGASSTPKWNVPDAGFNANEELIDVLTCNKVNADGNGGVSVTGSGGNPQVLMPTSALPKGGSVCPDSAKGAQSSSGQNVVAQVLGAVMAAVLTIAISFA
ncbi:glycoside hydrolase family 13 protein [Panus rudis PR-1116 ss-1]|nr:glycoside hydrolase family 13 protein [Panus rudis PR-1116 ss-1]